MSEHEKRAQLLDEKEEMVERRLAFLELTEAQMSERALSRLKQDFVTWLRWNGAAAGLLLAAIGYLGFKVTADPIVATAVKAELRGEVDTLEKQVEALTASLAAMDIDGMVTRYQALVETISETEVKLAEATALLDSLRLDAELSNFVTAG